MTGSRIKDSLFAALIGFVRRKGLISRGDRVLACVSGGADSVCMLHLLAALAGQWDLVVEVAHFDHGLRGSESEADARFVEDLAASLGLKFHLGRWRDGESGAVRGRSLQEAAREARYRFFRDVAEERSLDLIATAHTADDQAEEVIMRLLRGSGLDGLSGIAASQNGVVRPLLFARRREIEAFLRRAGLEWREDSSNTSPKYLRNRVRRDLLPLIESRFNPSIVRTLNRVAEVMGEAREALAFFASRAFDECVDTDGHSASLSIEAVSAYPAALRKEIYKRVLASLGLVGPALAKVHLDTVDAVVMGKRPSGEVHLPGGRFRRVYGWGGFTSDAFDIESGPSEIEVHGPGPLDLGGAGRLLLEERDVEEGRPGGTGLYVPGKALYLDSSSLHFPLIVRARRPGDRFQPLGMESEVSLKRFMISRRVPRHVREGLPLIVSGRGIACVCSVEVAHWARITNSTRRVLAVIWRPAGNPGGKMVPNPE